MKHYLHTFALSILLLAISVPANAAFSLTHKTGAYDALQDNGMQKVHTDYQILYARPGETVFLYRPERCTFIGYVRWYCYDTDRAVPAWYPAETSPKKDKDGNPVATRRIESTYAADTTGTNPKFSKKNEYGWFAFNYASDRCVSTDKTYLELKYTMHKGDSVYRIACDEGIWKDYTWNDNAESTEATLSKRIIFEIRPAEWMANDLEECKVSPENPTNDRFLEEHERIAPTGRQLYIGPDMMYRGSGKQIKLKQYYYYSRSNYHYLNSQGNVTIPSTDANWKWYKNGVEDPSITLQENSAQFVSVSSAEPGTVVYELKYNSSDGYYFNVARFTVTYMDVDQVGPSTNVPAPTKKMELLYEQNFNFDGELNTTDFAFWRGHFSPDESTYGYYDKNLDETGTSVRKIRQGQITWSEYAVTNKKAMWVKGDASDPQTFQHVDGTENVIENASKGYMLYCDGSQQPGQVFNLEVDADLCPGSTMYFSAWLCDASSTGTGNSAPNMDFVVTGIDEDKNEHKLATFTTGEFGINAVKKVGETKKMERGKWYQIMFPVKFNTEHTYPSYRLRIRNKSTSSDGNDFCIDDIRIYVQRPPVMPIQASTSDCIDKAQDTIRAYLRIDYQEIDNTVDKLYYQWREENRILTNAYYNMDSASNTFGCLPILSDEEIEAHPEQYVSANLLAFDAAYRETKDPIFRYIKEKVDNVNERYVLYVAQPIEVDMNHNYTGYVATHHESLGTKDGCGTYADMIIAGGTRIIIEDHTTLGDSIVTTCGNRTYTLDIVLIQIIQDETHGELINDTAFCRADWLIGDSTYVRENPSEYGGLTFDQIWNAIQLYRSNPESDAKSTIENLVSRGKFIQNAASITMVPSTSLSYTAFPLAGTAGSKEVCTSPRFLHIRPSTDVATMMAVGNAGEQLPPRVANLPRVVRISNAQKQRGSFTLPLYLKGEDNDDEYNIERVVLEASTNPDWTEVELNFNKIQLEDIDELVLSGSELTSLEAGYDYTFHIVFAGENEEHVGCERGRTYFTLRIVPDVVTWLGGNWNVDFNWSPFIPLEETDVILLPQNYNVTFSDTIYDFGYQKNHCRNIYLPAGMSMAGQEHLNIHGQVFLDVALEVHKWNLMSIPLEGVVSGDIFASRNESENEFMVADINQTVAAIAEDRYHYEIYQSPYDHHHDKWHVPTNTLTRELHPMEAYMIGVDDTQDDEVLDTLIIRLPKAKDVTYNYYNIDNHKWLPEAEVIERPANYGKPAWNGEPTITLKEVYGNVYMLGNPTFGHINITKLVEDNPDKLTGRYYMPGPLDVEPTRSEMTVFTHDVADEEEDVLLPPLKGVLLEGQGEPSNELIISISDHDITEPGFAPGKANVAPQKMKKHESLFNNAGGKPTGSIHSLAEPVVINETSMTIEAELDPYHEGEIAVLHLNRTLYRDGFFNTLCLPFSMSVAEIAASPLAGCELYEYLRSENAGNNQLLIYIRPVSTITAGMPYLIRWDMSETDPIDMPLVFHDVHITEVEGKTIGNENEIQFVGNIEVIEMENESRNNLFVGANNILYWPQSDNPNLRGFRAHFRIPTSGANATPNNTPARIVLQPNTTTDMESVQPAGGVRKFIKNGQVYIIKNGVMYNAQGQQVK